MSYTTSSAPFRAAMLALALLATGLTSAFMPAIEHGATFDNFTSICLGEDPDGDRYRLTFTVTNHTPNDASYVTIEGQAMTLSTNQVNLSSTLAPDATSGTLSVNLKTAQAQAPLRLALGGYIGAGSSEWRTAPQVITVPLIDCPDGLD